MTENVSQRIYQTLCVLTILMVVSIRIHLVNIPFERDEGEYAYAAQMISHGVPPYQQVYNMKFPGTYYMYTLAFTLFGEGIPAPRYLVILLQLAGATFLFLLGRRIINPLAGWLTAAGFMLFNLTLALQGIQTNAEHFVVACLIPALYFLYRGTEDKSVPDILLAGLFVSTACLMKQHALVFALAGLVWILYMQRQKSFKYLATYAVGGIIPVLLMCLYLCHAGVWDRFYFLTIQYARAYAGLVPYATTSLEPSGPTSGSNLSPLLIWFTIAGLVGLALPAQRPKTRSFLLLFLVASLLAVCPGFYFRRHYFLMVLPVFALLFTYSAFQLSGFLQPKVRCRALSIYIAASVAFFMCYQRECFFYFSPEQVTEQLYPGTPFAASFKIASYVKEHSLPTDRICQVGTEPQLFFLSQRRSASGYIYIYPMLENQKYADMMTGEFIAQSEKCKPAILIYSSHSIFDAGYNHQSRILKWFNNFKSQYQLAATLTPVSRFDERIVVLDTITPRDTLPETVPQIRVYKRVSNF